MTPLCIHSQRPWRKGWQFVCWTGEPEEARMCAKTSWERTCADRSRRFRSFQAGSTLWKRRASPRRRTSRRRSRRRSSCRPERASAGSGRSGSAAACRAAPRAARAIPSRRASGTWYSTPPQWGKALPLARRGRARAGARRRGSWRSMSARSMSAMSCVKPRLTTTRRAARSVRFSGNVYAGSCQPRSRRAFETSKTV